VSAGTGASRDPDPDPVLARRARAARLAELGQRVGYGCYLLAVAVFVVGAASGFAGWVVVVVVAALIAGSVTLLPGIILGYAVKAAEREEREDRRQGG
jgi:hypothetical protein